MTALLAPAAASDRARLLAAAQALALSLPGLKLATHKSTERGSYGRHGRRQGGVGFDFFETRRWRPGDPLRMIDEKISARNADGEFLVRVPEWETPQAVWLWCDKSASMRWKSREDLPAKEERALILTLAMAQMLAASHERIGFLDGMSVAATGRHGQDSILHALFAARAGTGPLPPPRQASHGIAVLIGDFLLPVSELRAHLVRLARAGLTGILVRILDPAERDPAALWQGHLRLEGAEGETPVMLGGGRAAIDAYQAAFLAHEAELADCAKRLGWSLLAHETSAPPRQLLLALAQFLAQPRLRLTQTG